MTQITNDNRVKHFVDDFFLVETRSLFHTKQKFFSVCLHHPSPKIIVWLELFISVVSLACHKKCLRSCRPVSPRDIFLTSWLLSCMNSSELPLLLISSTGQHKIPSIHVLHLKILWDSEAFLVAMRVSWWDNRTKEEKVVVVVLLADVFHQKPSTGFPSYSSPRLEMLPSLRFLLLKKKILSTNLGLKWEGIP